MKQVMKKFFATTILAIFMTSQASAQTEWTVNTRAWSTNYFTALIYNTAAVGVQTFLFSGESRNSFRAERLIPICDIVFPIGMSKKGFEKGVNDIYGPYHRTFGNPIKHIGDWGIGFDVSCKPSSIGAYVGTYFKSQEIVFKQTNTNLRGFYFQPRAGLIFGGRNCLETGIHYDVVTGCGGTVDHTDKDMLEGGLGLDFSLSSSESSNRMRTAIEFSMPLHNFLNTDYPGQQGMKRKVGYIMLTQRIML